MARARYGHGRFSKVILNMNLTDLDPCEYDKVSLDNLNNWIFECTFGTNATSYLMCSLADLAICGPFYHISRLILKSSNVKMTELFCNFVDMKTKQILS